MMNNLVCDLQYAMRLKELGYPQGESYFIWTESFRFFLHHKQIGHENTILARDQLGLRRPQRFEVCDAPTDGELIINLPRKINDVTSQNLSIEKYLYKGEIIYEISYWERIGWCRHAKLSNALAQIMIHLLVNKQLLEFKK